MKQRFKLGQKVKYLGYDAQITKVHQCHYTDRPVYNLYYNKGNGLTKVTNLYNLSGGEIKPC